MDFLQQGPAFPWEGLCPSPAPCGLGALVLPVLRSQSLKRLPGAHVLGHVLQSLHVNSGCVEQSSVCSRQTKPAGWHVELTGNTSDQCLIFVVANHCIFFKLNILLSNIIIWIKIQKIQKEGLKLSPLSLRCLPQRQLILFLLYPKENVIDYNWTEAEDIKKRWQEYIKELYKKDLHSPDNNNGVITHLEPDILECEVKWALESITTNKASGCDGIPVELFKILKDDAVKVLHSICQKIWKTQQWPQDWKRSVFIPIPKKGNPKECSNYHTIALISHANKIMLKILQAWLQQYVNRRTSRCSSWF